MRESKECVECGGIYFRPEYATSGQWEARKYCSAPCAGKAGARAAHGAPAEARTLVEKPLAELIPAVLERIKAPIERDLRVVRVGPNPRMLVCEYMELAQRRLCTVSVKRNSKFVRGMRFVMAEPASEADFVRPWVYGGPAPRRRGRW